MPKSTVGVFLTRAGQPGLKIFDPYQGRRFIPIQGFSMMR